MYVKYYFLLVDRIGISQSTVTTRSTRSKGIKQMFLIMPIIHVFRERRSYSISLLLLVYLDLQEDKVFKF